MLAALEGGRAADLEGVTLKGARFAILTSTVFDDIRDAPKAAFEVAVARLRDAGAEIEEITSPEVEEAMPISPILFTSEAYGTWGHLIEAAPEAMFAPIRERFESGKAFTAADYIAAWRRLEELRERWYARTAGYDAVLMPTAPILPPDAARLMTDNEYYVTENLLALRNTRVGNLMGLCGVTLPTGTPSCGILLSGKPFGEEALLRVAKAAEAVLR